MYTVVPTLCQGYYKNYFNLLPTSLTSLQSTTSPHLANTLYTVAVEENLEYTNTLNAILFVYDLPLSNEFRSDYFTLNFLLISRIANKTF